MEGIADVANVTIDSIVMTNLLYELTTACTSIIARKSISNSKDPLSQQKQRQMQPLLIHGRNLDYSLGDPDNPDILRKETIDITFQKGRIFSPCMN